MEGDMGQLDEILQKLQLLADPASREQMKRFGINTQGALGVSIYDLRRLAGKLRDHDLAEQLWQTGIHEARILASIVDDPSRVTPAQMDCWVKDFDSWDVCDQVTTNLFDICPYAYQKALEWAEREEEYVKRAAFALIAGMAVHDKAAPDQVFLDFLQVIKCHAVDERNFVRKAVNWALRNIGKRNPALHQAAVQTALEIRQIGSPAARWISADALRELNRTRDKK
jgi:3-methyladenine DNA glycosylase AlkD